MNKLREVINMADKRKDNKGRVLKTGESQRKSDNRYVYDYTDLNGIRKRVYALTLTELRKKEQQIQRDLLDGINTEKGDMTLNDLFKMYMDTKTDLRDTTRHNYMGLWEYRVQHSMIGNMKISQLKMIHIRSFYSELAKEGLAESTIKGYHDLIYPALELAVESDMIRKNPAKEARKGVGGTKKKREAMTRSEEEIFLNFVKESKIYKIYYPMIRFVLCTGLRVGELTGLRWHDVDFKENVVHVRQQLIYKNLDNGCEFHIQALKTEAGRRDIPLTDAAREALMAQRNNYLMLGKSFKCQEVDGISDFVFTNNKGNCYATNAINSLLKNIVNTYNSQEEKLAAKEHRDPELLPHISSHILRHTACTRMAESGMNPKVLQYIMGHASIEVTMDVYTHLDYSQIKENFETVQTDIE